MDFGATKHLVRDISLLSNIRDSPVNIHMRSANGQINVINKIGDLGEFGEALYYPQAMGNFVSENSLRKAGWYVTKPADRIIVTRGDLF
jgi:hypothetical protein